MKFKMSIKNIYRIIIIFIKCLRINGEKKLLLSLLFIVIFFLFGRSVNICLRGYRYESLVNCFFLVLCYIEFNFRGSKNRIVRVVFIVFINKVYYSISDDFKIVWVVVL